MDRVQWSRSLIFMAFAVYLNPLALAAPSRFAGVSWREPAGMQASTSFISSCPARCVTYRGNGGSDDWWPLIRVHEAMLGSAQSALNRLSAAYRESGKRLRILKSGQDQIGAVKVELSVLEIKDDEGDVRPNYSAVLMLEQGGVTLPLELYALNQDDLKGSRFKLLGALADTVKLDPQMIKKESAARDVQFASLNKAIATGYANGKRAQVYDDSSVELRQNFTADGVEMRTDRTTITAAFLPGGVFLTRPGEPDYRAPDLRRMGDGELPARWKSVPGGYQVTAPDGTARLYRFGKPDGSQRRLTLGSATYWELPRLTAADLTGVFNSVLTSLSVSDKYRSSAYTYLNTTSVSFLPDGRYRTEATNQQTRGGRWSYDPASYTLTLRPDAGSTTGGPTFTRTFDPARRAANGTDWTLLGSESFRRSK